MTVPIPVLQERPSVASVGRENGAKKAAAYSDKNKFAQKLDRAVKKQNPPEVGGQNQSSQKTLAEESGQQVAPEKECQAKETGLPGGLVIPEPEPREDILAKETEIEAFMSQPVIVEPAVTGVVLTPSDTNTAEGSPTLKSVQSGPVDQAADSPEAGTISLPQRASEQSDNKADTSRPTDNGKVKIPELLDKPEFELKPNNDAAADNSKKADQQEAGQVFITKMPHEDAAKKNAVPVREPAADKTSMVSSPVVEKTEVSPPTDVQKIMAMENHIRPVKVVKSEADGEKTGPNNSRSEQGQDLPKFSLLPHQTDSVQVSTSSKIPEFPGKEQVDPKDLIQQIVKKAEVLLKSDISEMKMQLKPEFLGKMLIKVTVEEGTVVTKIITENQHVKQVLEANLNSLRQNLEANGMKVEKTEVSVQLFNDGGGGYSESDSNRYPLWSEQQGQNRRSYPGNSYGLPEMENLPDLPEETVPYGIGSEGQVNYLI